MSVQISKDEEGIAVELLIDSGEDISAATDLEMIFQTPQKSSITKTAVFTTDGTDGRIRYVVTASDLNSKGVWRVRGKYDIGSEVKLTTWGVIEVVD